METPNVRGFTVLTLQLPKDWEKLSPVARVSAMEKWAAGGLKSREAAVGVYILNDPKRCDIPIRGEFWILRHGDYDTGRANVEVQMREGLSETTRIWQLRHDVLTEGVISEFAERAVYIRTQSGSDLVWELSHEWKMNVRNPKDNLPAVRAFELFRQCRFIEQELGVWLRRNTTGPECTDLSPYQRSALHDMLGTSLMWLSTAPEELERFKQHVAKRTQEKDVGRAFNLSMDFLRKVQKDLRKTNRLATPEQYALYNRLKASYEFVQEYRHDPEDRTISLGALLRLQKRWINAAGKHLPAFQTPSISGRVS